jgi:hypothetical protein
MTSARLADAIAYRLNIVVWISTFSPSTWRPPKSASSSVTTCEKRLGKELIRCCFFHPIMRFSAASVFVLASSVAAFQQTPVAFVARSTSASSLGNLARFSTAEDVDVEAPVKKQPTKKEERLRMMKSDRFHRKGFKEVRDGVETSMKQQYQSSIVKDLKTSNYLLEKDGVKVYLAKVRFIAIARCNSEVQTDPLRLRVGNFNLTMFVGFYVTLD